MVELEDELVQRCKVYGGRAPGGQSQSIVREEINSFVKIISADATVGSHGKNINLAAVDELHEQPNRQLIDSLRSSMVSANKPQPLIIYATTSDYEREGSICNEIYNYACKVRDNLIQDESFLPIIYEAAKDDDWTAPETWAKANPNLNVSVSEEFLASECKRAQEEPAYENTFKRLHLNVRTEQAVRLIPMDKWDACGEKYDIDILAGRYCYAGLDLSTWDDLSACVLVFPPQDGSEYYHILPFMWCPKASIEERSRRARVPYDLWERQGYLEATPGNSIDHELLREKINELGRKYRIVEIPCDPANAAQISIGLQKDGFEVVLFRQGMMSMNEPTKFMMARLMDNKLRHNGHPVLRWMASNAAGKPDSKGNIMVEKGSSKEKVDGIIAMVMGLGRAMLKSEPKTSPYNDPNKELVFI
jgi:phage terminase large subunit-like protein